MQFEKNVIYHVFNQGNNRQPIFYNKENYYFFLQKMRTFLSPHVEMLCYCLMPNHFHWLFQVKAPEIQIVEPGFPVKVSSALEAINSSDDLESSNELMASKALDIRHRTLNNSLAILLRSYTRAINKQENRSGALFRPRTKSKTGRLDQFITVDRYRTKTPDFRAFPDDEYGYQCFQYIHNNPVAAGLCSKPVDWEFSSARDFSGLRAGTLCNQGLAKELLKLPDKLW